MTENDILKHEFKLNNRLHRFESNPYWCKISKVNNKLIGIDGNGNLQNKWTPKSLNNFKGNGIYKISFPIWCKSCNDYADPYCGNFHDTGDGGAEIGMRVDEFKSKQKPQSLNGYKVGDDVRYVNLKSEKCKGVIVDFITIETGDWICVLNDSTLLHPDHINAT